jgi:hypothetical protein
MEFVNTTLDERTGFFLVKFPAWARVLILSAFRLSMEGLFRSMTIGRRSDCFANSIRHFLRVANTAKRRADQFIRDRPASVRLSKGGDNPDPTHLATLAGKVTAGAGSL